MQAGVGQSYSSLVLVLNVAANVAASRVGGGVRGKDIGIYTTPCVIQVF